jgi:hypothetical protein
VAKLTLEEVLEQVKALTPAEQQKVRELLDTMAPHEPTPGEEEAFARKLAAEGILELPTRDMDATEIRGYVPIEVSGKPLSETIIEERR